MTRFRFPTLTRFPGAIPADEFLRLRLSMKAAEWDAYEAEQYRFGQVEIEAPDLKAAIAIARAQQESQVAS